MQTNRMFEYFLHTGTKRRRRPVPACKECNTKKKYLLPIEWEESILEH